MKKFLSLVLALVMTMSLVTISAGAEFTDDSDVKYAEAVDVISALGIVGGYADGSFRPEGTLTRGAAAKIICIMTLGADMAAALPTSVASYTDVPAGSTYAPYVGYLKSAGMVSGYADGSFKPADKLTGYAFLKMLLGALGYDQAVEGYVGEGWQIKVAKQAKELELYDGNKNFNGNALATREEACLYALNALQIQPVEYVNGSTVTINGIAITTGATRQPDANYPNGLWEKGFEKFVIQNFKDDGSTDALGRPANFYKNDKTTIGTYAESPKKVYTKGGLKEKTLYTDLGLDANATYKLFAEGANTESDATGYYQPVTIGKGVDTKIDQTYNVNGMVLEFYKSAKMIVALTPKVLQVTDVTDADPDTDTKRSITLDGTYTFETEDFAEDDMVLCFTNDYTNVASGVKAAEKLTGKVTKISGSDIWVDGVKYTKSATTWAGLNITAPSVKDEVEFYLDDAGYIVKMDAAATSTSTENVAFVEKTGKQTSGDYDGTNTYKATLRYADGTKQIVVLKNAAQADNTYLTKIVTYKTSSEKIVLSNGDADKLYNGANATFTKGQPVITVGSDSFAATASTKFVYVEKVGTDDEAVATYTGFKTAPDFAASNNVGLLADKDGKAVLVFVYGNFVSAASENASYIIYNTDLKEIADEDIDGYYEAVMIENGESKTVKVETSVWTGAVASAAAANGTSVAVLDSYTVSSKGAIDDVTAVAVGGSDTAKKNVTAAADVTYKKGDEIVTIGGTTYTYDENTVVYKVNDDKDEVTTTTIEKVANNTNASKVYESIAVSVTEKNTLKLDVVFLFAK